MTVIRSPDPRRLAGPHEGSGRPRAVRADADLLAAPSVPAARLEPLPTHRRLRPGDGAGLEHAHRSDPACDPGRSVGATCPGRGRRAMDHRSLRPDGWRSRGGQGDARTGDRDEHRRRRARRAAVGGRRAQLRPGHPAIVRANVGAAAVERPQHLQRPAVDCGTDRLSGDQRRGPPRRSDTVASRLGRTCCSPP